MSSRTNFTSHVCFNVCAHLRGGPTVNANFRLYLYSSNNRNIRLRYIMVGLLRHLNDTNIEWYFKHHFSNAVASPTERTDGRDCEMKTSIPVYLVNGN